MLETIEIENFRGFAQAKIEGLTGLNILVGPNNCGKSTLLEAGLLIAEQRSEHYDRALQFVAERRAAVFPDTYSALFFDTGKTVIKLGKRSHHFDIGARKVAIEHWGECALSFTNSLDDLFYEGAFGVFVDVDRGREHGKLVQARSAAFKNGYYPTLIELLRPLLPQIQSLDISVDPQAVLYVTENGLPRPWPAFSAGDGFLRLLLLASRLSGSQGKTAFIEEPEAFMHPTTLPQLSKLFWQATNAGTQLIIATHSMELISSLLADPAADLPKMAVYRMRLEQGRMRHARLDGQTAYLRVDQLGEDLRQ